MVATERQTPRVQPLACLDEEAYQARIDRLMLIGCVITGTVILGLIGMPILLYSFVLLRRGLRQGMSLRPLPVTIVAAICMIDSLCNLLTWGVILLPSHDVSVVYTFMTGYGRVSDGAYYFGFNTTATGGVPLAGEMAMIFANTVFLFPARLVACWGFMKMKRWGYQFLIVTSYVYVFMWLFWFMNIAQTYDWRFPHASLGFLSWWFFILPYLGPFIVIPYLHTVNRELWSD